VHDESRDGKRDHRHGDGPLQPPLPRGGAQCDLWPLGASSQASPPLSLDG
jgi:hypothetical protein